MCRRSGVHPCSRFRAQAAVVCGWRFPIHQINIRPSPKAFPGFSMTIYLECEMLQEVCCAIGLVRFRPRSGVNPNTNSRSLCPWRVLGGNLRVFVSPLNLTASIISMRAYRHAIGESCALRGDAILRGDWSCKTSPHGGVERSTLAEALGEVKC